MKTIIYTLAFLTAINLNSQALNEESNSTGMQLSFIYPLGTNGIKSYEKQNNVSFNLLLGYNGGVEGMEMGALLNINQHDVKGIQLGGFSNVTGGNMMGLQLAGFGNINSGKSEGMQGAGFINYSRNGGNLIQVSGFTNITENTNGLQASGFLNYAGNSIQTSEETQEPAKLAQLSGFANVAGDIEGIQASVFINVAGHVKGMQIAGFINICDSIDGIPLAFINVVRYNGYRKLSVWSSEAFYVNTSFKIGVERFYTIFSLGYRPNTEYINWVPGVGFGTVLNLKNNNYADIEWIYHYLADQRFWGESNLSYADYNQLKINFRKQLSEHLSIFGGPSVNVLYSYGVNDFKPSWAIEHKTRYDRSYNFWMGFNAGFQF